MIKTIPRTVIRVSLVVSCLISMLVAPVNAFTPESPEVKRLIRKGVNFLSRTEPFSEEQRVLTAYALLKAEEPKTNPVVQAALKDCIDWCRSDEIVDGRLNSIYQISVVGLFFCELDPTLYHSQIKRLINALENRQKSFGGWGYPEGMPDWSTGDTSMTQYAILFAWTARVTGAAKMSDEKIRKATNWLLRTQDVSGAWGYQGIDPGSYRRVEQEEVRHSLAAAGVGSLYICSDMLGFTKGQVSKQRGEGDGLPPALQLIVPDGGKSGDAFSQPVLKKALRDGDKWFAGPNYTISPKEYVAYYLYTLERYKSFKDAAEGKRTKEPGWYNDGVRMLRQKQDKNGAWDLAGGNGRAVDTAFVVLFLLRNTQKSIAKQPDSFDGLLVAGRGLPKSGQLLMKNGQVAATPFQGSSSTLMEILEDESHPDFDSVSRMSIPIAKTPRALATQQQKMRRLVRAEAFEARMVGVKTLSKICNLDNVPILIYALSDPDPRVRLAARDGLRFISRKFNGFGLSGNPSEEDVDTAIEKWKSWYLEIRPDAKFED